MNKRQRQLSDVVQRSLTKFIAFELEAVGLPSLTITGVDVSPDMRLAKVFFVPTFATDIEIKEYLKQLAAIAPRLRHELSSSANLRHTPKLKFLVDHGFTTGEEIDAVMRKLKVNDDPEGDT